MKRFLSVLGVLLLFLNGLDGELRAQTARLIASKGEVQIVNGMDVKIPVTGMSLKGVETFILGKNAYISLIDEHGRTAEIRGEGYYEYDGVFTSEKGNKSNAAYKYADYVLGRMNAEGKKNRLGATGYYIRDNMRQKEHIRMYIPGAGKYYQDDLRLSWEKPAGENHFRVEIYNMFRESLAVFEVNENQLMLKIDQQLGQENILLIKVSTPDQLYESETYALKRLGSYNREDISAGLIQMASIYKRHDAISRFTMAGYFEYNNLLADALTCYLEAIDLAPDVPLYQEAYEEFLLRNHLIRF
ncbi:hypothetical protein [Fulvivirga sedimenti]|uniref:Uncharacterized protein n=1 Tax=Fulvivirga sedimenti TaxID=2879465 RepID=A0A9X1HL14_9BACT|nr:hypothetical protein [Fulvivirga sedimenti]MCA6074128.1 hypothetical protein [Fulvivirga sedimenti]